jgi:hypothetical protein
MIGVFQKHAGGRRGKKFGGGRFSDSVRNLTAAIKNKFGAIADGIDRGAAAAVNNIGTLGMIGAVVGVANHPTVVGNIAELLSRLYEKAAAAATSAEWAEYAAAAEQIKDALVRAGVATAQALQGPVGALAITIAITLYRARSQRKSVGQLLKDDAVYVGSLVARGVTGQMQAFVTAAEKESKDLGPRRLKELAARIERPAGPGAAAMSSAAATGAPAAFGSPAGIGITAASPGRVGQIPAAAQRLGASSSSSDDVGMSGGRRRKGKSRKTRGSRKTRRMTRRSKTITALKFVY